MIISVQHLFQALLGWQAPFSDATGHRAFVREYPHIHADYFAAFTTSGLSVRRCIEPPLCRGADCRAGVGAFCSAAPGRA